VQHMIGQTGQPSQTGWFVEIGKHGRDAGAAPLGHPAGIAQHGIDAIAADKTGKSAAGNVSAADDQYFLHGCIVADDQGEPMSHQITVQPSGRQFAAEAGETVLEAALRQGLTMPYGCKDGACGACKGKVVEGSVDHGKSQAHALTEADKATGLTLYCCATAQSDLVIECKQMSSASDFPIKILPARIEKLERVAHDVIDLHLRLPGSEQFQFLAGQYIDFLLKDGKRRSYSLANAMRTDGIIELHIRLVPGGLFTEQVFNTLKVRDILRFEGPLGGFFLRQDSKKPVILLAGGTGFAPLKAIVEQAIADKSERPLHIYWGAKARADLYMHALPEKWAAEYPHIKYVPVLSEPDAGDAWNGRTGFVHQAVLNDFPDLSGYQVYACGSPVMIDAAKKDFVEQSKLPEEEFFADAFTFASHTA